MKKNYVLVDRKFDGVSPDGEPDYGDEFEKDFGMLSKREAISKSEIEWEKMSTYDKQHSELKLFALSPTQYAAYKEGDGSAFNGDLIFEKKWEGYC